MSPVKDDYQDIRPVPLHLLEESVTSSLYCGIVKGMEDQVSALVEAFLVEVYRCRVCQFTSGLKDGISTHLLERHELGASSCPVLPCLEKEDGECLGVDVGMRVDGEDNEIDQNGSPYNLEDDLHSASKDGDNHMDHMGLERMSFFLPLYGMLPNISPRSCDMGQGSSNSDGSLHVAQTCEVSTLFPEEEEGHEEEDDEDSIFQLEDDVSVNLSCPMGSVVDEPENQDEEKAQSAHLMTLGLCRISTAKPLPAQAETLDTKLPLIPVSQDCSETSLDDKVTQQPPPRPLTPKKWSGRERTLTCILCCATLTSKHLLEVHLKSHDGDSGFKCLGCGWRAGGWREMELHWRGHGRRRRRQWERVRERRSKLYSCQVCPRTFRTNKSCDTHKQKHAPIRSSQGCSVCLHCDYSDKSSDKLHKHTLSRHKTTVDRKTDNFPDRHDSHEACYSQKNLHHEGNCLEDFEGPESENWCQLQKKGVKLRGRKHAEEKETNEGQEEEKATKRKAFCCALCNRKFSTKLTLCRHMGIHQGNKPFECPHCQYSTRLKASLVQHLRVHTGEKPYKCPECSYASIDSSSLRRHSRTHTQERPYRCQSCPYSSIQKKSLDLHARRHHTGESFPCHLCQYSSPDRQLLVRHLRKYHTEQSPSPPVLEQQLAKYPINSITTGGEGNLRKDLI